MKIKGTLITILSLLLVVSMQLMVFAHSGRTDSSGGHRDNKNKSGLGYYHYHCGGYPPHLHSGGVCPYKTTTTKKTYTAPKTVYATKITAVEVPITINDGESTQLKGAVYPANALDNTIEWKSNNPEIVDVTSSGELHAVGVGKATVTATTSRGTSSTFTITVKEVFAESIVIQNKFGDMLLGETKSLEVAFTPENTTNKNVEWFSDNAGIVSVTTDGKVTAKAIGTATITATQGELTDICVIEVLPIEAKSIEIIFSDKDLGTTEINKLEKGNQIELKTIINPENTTDKTIKWSVSDASIAEIDENGKLTAISSGTVTVTATTANGIEKSIDIEVYSYTGIIVGIGGVAAIASVACFLIRKRKKNADI